MTLKPKARKIVAPPTSDANAAQGDQPPKGEALQPEAAEPDADDSKKSGRRKLRAAPPSRPAAPESTRGVLVTLDERLKVLEKLPSLATPPELDSEMVTAPERAPRPSVPAPLPEEPTPSELIDRGSPIPENYGMDRLAAFPRDPQWLFVYWELQGGAIDRLRFHHSAEIIDNARWVLRVRAGGDARATFVDIDLRIGQWYLHVTPATTFVIDMGLINQQGHFVEVLKGKEVSTPSAGVSSICDERWVILRDELEKLLKASGVSPELLSPQPGSERPALPRSELPRAIGIFSSYLLQQQGTEKK